MSQVSIEADSLRRRAGLLSALVKLYVNAKTLINKDGSAEEATQLQEELQVQYDLYVESHEIALVTYTDREKTFFVHLSVFGLTVMYASYKFLEFVFRETSKAGL